MKNLKLFLKILLLIVLVFILLTFLVELGLSFVEWRAPSFDYIKTDYFYERVRTFIFLVFIGSLIIFFLPKIKIPLE